MDNGFCFYSQHFAGWINVVVECLSRDFYLDDDFLAHLLLFFCPNQMPPSFGMSPLPPEIASFATGTLEASLVPPQGC